MIYKRWIFYFNVLEGNPQEFRRKPKERNTREKTRKDTARFIPWIYPLVN